MILLSSEGFCCLLIDNLSVDFFLSVGLGLGETVTPQVRSRKSISSERTFSATGDERLLYSKLGEYFAHLGCCFPPYETYNSTVCQRYNGS